MIRRARVSHDRRKPRSTLRRIGRVLAIAAGGTALLAAGLAFPIAWTEATCRSSSTPQAEPRFITDPSDRRAEARTFLTYPEWHVVYAYEELGQTLESGHPHDFAYWPAITGFWHALCAVSKEADSLGDAGTDAKLTIYTVGASFTLEMLAKAAYEETLGRLTLLVTGGSSRNDAGATVGSVASALPYDTVPISAEPSPQDAVETEMARTYGAFLHQTPWYRFPFDDWTTTLWKQPLTSPLRGWERRLAVGLEWKGKAAYAGIIASAAGAMGADETEMKVHVTGLTDAQVEALGEGVLSVSRTHGAADQGAEGQGLDLTVKRYRAFTQTAEAIAAVGGDFTEIAGNDDIMVTILASDHPRLTEGARVLRRIDRQGSELARYLVAVKVSDLANLIRALPGAGAKLEHIYDY